MSTNEEIKVGENAPHRIAVVESASREKTRKVTIQYVAKHPKYGKYVRKRTVLHVHDATNATGLYSRLCDWLGSCRLSGWLLFGFGHVLSFS